MPEKKHNPNKKPNYALRRTVAAGVVSALATVAGVAGFKVAAGESQPGSGNTPQLEVESFGPEYRIPKENEPYRQLIFGHIYVDLEGKQYALDGIDRTAEYIHNMNSNLDYEKIRELLITQNVQFQKSLGKRGEAIDPVEVAEGQVAKLPAEYGPIGTLVYPAEPSGTEA